MAVDYNPEVPGITIIPLPDNTSNISVTRTPYKATGSFRFWCQKVLPLVYDDSLSYYELLCKVVNFLNEVIENVDNLHDENSNVIDSFGALQNYVNANDAAMTQFINASDSQIVDYINSTFADFQTAYNQLQTYVNTYFDNLDVQQEINNKLDSLVEDGTFEEILVPYLTEYQSTVDSLTSRVSALERNYTPGGTTADAELADIRVAYNNTIYNTAGNAVRAQVEDLHKLWGEYVGDRIQILYPTNWYDPEEVTRHFALDKSAVATATNNRAYTGFIPVSEGDVVRMFRMGGIFSEAYQYCITAYDENQVVQPSKGKDTTGSFYNVPEGIFYVRITFDDVLVDYKPEVTKNLILNSINQYTEFFEPHSVIAEDFLTEQTAQAISDFSAGELNAGSYIINSYACSIPRQPLRMTKGISEEWYKVNCFNLYPHCQGAVFGGSDYCLHKNDSEYFPNDTTLSSINGFRFDYYDNFFNKTYEYKPGSYGAERYIINLNLSDCSVLAIGDSTIDSDNVTGALLTAFETANKNLTLLGTLGSATDPNNKNEGRAGWKATDYLTNKKYDSVVNPFYNPTSETFDFTYYMTNQNYSGVDFVIIQLGINDLYSNTSMEGIEACFNAIKTMCLSIKEYDSSIRVILNLPTPPNSNQDMLTDKWLPAYRSVVINYAHYVTNHITELGGKARISYAHLILNPSLDIRDNIHPTSAGYQKIANEIINQINHYQNPS